MSSGLPASAIAFLDLRLLVDGQKTVAKKMRDYHDFVGGSSEVGITSEASVNPPGRRGSFAAGR